MQLLGLRHAQHILQAGALAFLIAEPLQLRSVDGPVGKALHLARQIATQVTAGYHPSGGVLIERAVHLVEKSSFSWVSIRELFLGNHIP